MISGLLPPCCSPEGPAVRCEEFALSLRTDTNARRRAAIDHGFIAGGESRWRTAFTAGALVDSGDATRFSVYVRLVLAVVGSAALPLTVTTALAMATLLGSGATYGPLLAVLAFLVSNLCHELGHLLAIGLLSAQRSHVHVVARLGFAHVVRNSLPPLREAVVAVSGPLLVASCCAAAMIFATHIIEVVVLASIGVGHLGTLLFPVGDGANLRDAVRSARSSKVPERRERSSRQ